MEGVGGRLGRSSSRYGPAVVFTGPVRKWKKKWIHVTPSSAASTDTHHNSSSSNNNNNNNNNNNASHILLYKWTPIRNTTIINGGDANDESQEPPRRKMKYIPIAVLEEQNNEALTDEAKPAEKDSVAPEPESPSKPDMNDVPTEENQVSERTHAEKQDLDKSTVDLSLNLNALNDGDGDRDVDGDEEPEDQPGDGQLDEVGAG